MDNKYELENEKELKEWEVKDNIYNEDDDEKDLALLETLQELKNNPNVNQDWGKDHQLFKFMVRYSNKSIQDYKIWIEEIQPEFDRLSRYLCKSFSYQIEDSSLDKDDELEALLGLNEDEILPQDVCSNDLYDESENMMDDDEDIDELEECVDGFTQEEVVSGAMDKTLKNNPHFEAEENPLIKEDTLGDLGRNIHIQCYWSLKKRIRASTLCKALNRTQWRGIEIKGAINENALIDYTQKEDTRIPGGGPWTELGKTYCGEDVLSKDMYRWQSDLYRLFTKSIPVSRVVYMVVDTKGCSGKSTYQKMWRFLHPNQFGSISDASTVSQLTSTLCNKIKAKKVYMYDACRSKKKIDDWRLILNVLENLSNGWVQSNLYGGVKVCNELLCAPPHICIFTNSVNQQIINEMSHDRWRIYKIKEDKDNLGIENAMLIPYIDKKKRVWAPTMESLLDKIESTSEEEDSEEENGDINDFYNDNDIENVENVEVVENVKNVKNVEIVKNVETVKSVENVKVVKLS